MLLLILHGLEITAQKGQAILGGVALDAISQDTLYWVRIIVLNETDELVAYFNTSYHGTFNITNLSPGVYTLKCISYTEPPYIIRNVRLKEGFTSWYPRIEKDTTTNFYSLDTEDSFFSDMQWEDDYEYEPPSLYPNPVRDYFTLDVGEYFKKGKIYDLNGRMIQSFEAENFQKVDVSNLIRGAYICVLEAPKWSYSYPMKFIKY